MAIEGGDVLYPMQKEWIITMKTTSENLSAMRSSPPKIQRVPELLRKKKSNKEKHFDPEVISLGPYHHGLEHLMAMEKHKEASPLKFAEGDESVVSKLYSKVREVTPKARDCYLDKFNQIDDDSFAKMMLLDACFVLHFIDTTVNKNPEDLTVGAHLRGFITRDIFLLENQIPYTVRNVIMSTFKKVNLNKFIDLTIGSVNGVSPPQKRDPVHLLDLLHSFLLGPQKDGIGDAKWHRFRSVTELKEAGILFKKKPTRHLADIEFVPGYIHGHLDLPSIIVDDLTRPRLLNLIAFEMCPGNTTSGCGDLKKKKTSGYGVTSYLWFLDNLIDHADDVKELRLKGILLNALGSDQQVAELFNELATDLTPDPGAHAHVMTGMDNYYRKWCRVEIVRMLNAHFSSPWSTISFIAGVVLLGLTCVQTVYSVK